MAEYGAAVPNSRANPLGMVSQPPSKVSGLLYGLGLGGFIDGIVLHQNPSVAPHGQRRRPLPGEHHRRVGSQHPGRRLLSFGDLGSCPGRSIAAITAWRQGRLAPNWSFHFGLVLTGWGIFNVVGLIDHQILGVHHVRDDLDGPLPWDMGFLIFGVLLIVGGWTLHKAGLRTLERRALTTR